MDPERRKHIRRGIARNPATPPDLVLRLAVDPDALQEICRWREDLTVDLVGAIVALGTADTADWLGDNATLSHDVMWFLARQSDPELRMAAVLYDFWYGDPVSDVPVPLLEHLAADPDHLVRWVVASHPHTPAEVLVRLAADAVPRVRAKVASTWRDAPDEVRRGLLGDPEPEVRNAALSRPPADLVPALFADPQTRFNALPYLVLTPELAAELATDPVLRPALVTHPDLPVDVMEKLADDPDCRLGLLTNRSTPDDLRHRLYQSPGDDKVRVGLEWLHAMPMDERLGYLDSPFALIRRELARTAYLPRGAVDRLLRDTDPGVRRLAARYSHVPGEVLESLVREQPLAQSLLEHPNFPRDAFARFAASPDPRVRVNACHDTDLPADLVAQLAADGDPEVRRAAAEHPRLPEDTLPALLHKDVPVVAEAAAANPVLPVAWMVDLIDGG